MFWQISSVRICLRYAGGLFEHLSIICTPSRFLFQGASLESLSAWRPSKYPSFMFFAQTIHSFGHESILSLVRGRPYTINNDTSYHPLYNNLLFPSETTLAALAPKTLGPESGPIISSSISVLASAIKSSTPDDLPPVCILSHDACYITTGGAITPSGHIVGLSGGVLSYNPDSMPLMHTQALLTSQQSL